MNILDALQTAQANLFRSKLRTFLTTAAVFIGTFALSLTTSMSSGVKTYVNQQLEAFAQPDTIYVTSKIDGSAFGGGTGPEEYDPNKKTVNMTGPDISTLAAPDLAKVQSDPDVVQAVPYVVATADYIQAESSKKYVVTTDSFFNKMQLSLAAGELLDSDDTSSLLLPYTYVTALGFDSPADAVGKQVTLRFSEQAAYNPLNSSEPQTRLVTLSIKGVLINSLAGQTVYLSTKLQQQLSIYQNGSIDKYSMIVASTKKDLSTQDLSNLKSRLDEKGYSARTYEDQVESLKQVLNMIQIVLSMFGIIALASAAIGIINTLLMAVLERTREIGLLKALGMRRFTVFSLFCLESISIGFWGGILGISATYFTGKILNVVLSNGVLKNLEGFSLFSFPMSSMLGIVLLGMTIGFLAGALPALRASKLDPIEALRYE